MSLPIVATTEQIEAGRLWVQAYYRAFDSFNIDHWLIAYHKPDVILNLCNTPTMKGCQEIRAYFEKQNPQLTSMKHDIHRVDVHSDRIYVQNESTFIVKKDPEQKEIKIKAIAVFSKNIDEEKVSSADVYFDPTPLIERITMFL